MQSIRTAFVWAVAIGLAGCAEVAPPHYASDHPADPTAAAAAVEPPAGALATYRTFDEAAPQPNREDSRAHHH